MTKEISCAAPNCKFRLRSEDENELVALVQQHAKSKHQTDVSGEELLAAARESE